MRPGPIAGAKRVVDPQGKTTHTITMYLSLHERPRSESALLKAPVAASAVAYQAVAADLPDAPT